MKAKLFTAAWTAARAAAARFGGSARDFFAVALRQAYAEARAEAAPKSRVLEVVAVENDYNSRMRGGTSYTFAYLPDGHGGYLPGVRADKLNGALFLSIAAFIGGAGYARASDRHSATRVRVELPVGTILKATRGGRVVRVDADGETPLRLVGNMRRGGGWVTVVEDEDGREVELA